MENIIEAEYTVVQERTLEVIATEIKTIDNHVCKVALDGAIEIGQRLNEAKEKVEHGEWGKWCQENLGYSIRQAQRFMEISEKYGTEESTYFKAISNATTSSFLSISKALSILQVPENDVENFIEENDVEDMTVKELEEKIRRLNEEKEDKQKEIENLKDRFERSETDQQDKSEEIERLKSELEELKESSTDPADIERKEALLALAEKEKTELEEKNQKLKEKLAKAKEDRQKEIDEAIEKAKAEAKEEATKEKEAELENLKKAAEEAKEEKELALKKLEQSSNEDVMKFKLHIDQLQEMFLEVKNDIENIQMSNADQADRMKIATKTVMEQLIGRLE